MTFKVIGAICSLVIGSAFLVGCDQTPKDEPGKKTENAKPEAVKPADKTTPTAELEKGKPAPTQVTAPGKNEPPKEDVKVVVYKNDKGEILCPVMNKVIKSEKDAVSFQDYKGVRYYFCCGECPEKFKADPEKYIKKPAK